jgi:hypothetical protein
MNCVIIRNIIIKSEREVVGHHPFHQGPHAELDQVSAKFTAFFVMHQEI